MTTRELFKRRVIELIHGLPYEEAVKKELVSGCNVEVFEGVFVNGGYIRNAKIIEYDYTVDKCIVVYKGCSFLSENLKPKTSQENYSQSIFIKTIGLPITIGRVMKAIQNKQLPRFEQDFNNAMILCYDWKLTNKDGSECIDNDQTDETIEKLYNLIK